MKRPASVFDQYEGKCQAELYRGSGQWPLQQFPCALELIWAEFNQDYADPWDCYFNNWEAGYHDRRRVRRIKETLVLPPLFLDEDAQSEYTDQLATVTIEQFPDDAATIEKAEQFVRSLLSLGSPVTFEVLGLGAQQNQNGWTEPSISVQFVAQDSDVNLLHQQLLSHYPNSAVLVKDHLDEDTDGVPARDLREDRGFGSILSLSCAYLSPLKTFTRIDTDPLGVAIAAMEHLGEDEWAVLQVNFIPAVNPWNTTLQQVARDPYKEGQYLFHDLSDQLFTKKFSSPLFTVSIRLAALQESNYRQLEGWAGQFAAPPQSLEAYTDQSSGHLGCSLESRLAFSPGMLLNTRELASLVHLPASTVTSERLRRISSRTRPAPVVSDEPGSVLLGNKVHRGQTTPARISDELRPRHCYIAGASGTGKSTLLLNMIRQDIQNGYGVGLIDPHGDLVDSVLSIIPPSRIQDVAYFNPTDTEHPPAFNILQCRDRLERERTVSETVATIHRFFPDSWGPRLQHILTHALATILRFDGATLSDLKRLLIDDNFRRSTLAKIKDPDLLAFWNNEFPGFPKGSVDPILNKLSPFLLNSTIRNIICQRQGKFDFDDIINNRKIFLANLSKGTLGDEVSGVLGTFIMSKIVNATFRRSSIPENDRVPFYLYSSRILWIWPLDSS